MNIQYYQASRIDLIVAHAIINSRNRVEKEILDKGV